MNKLLHDDKKMVPLCLAYFGLLFFVLSVISEGTYGGGDSYNHYLFAKYSWKHPILLLHQWAKPFFTLVASPFAQAGFVGIKLFNTICALLTAWLCFKLVKDISKATSWPVIVFVCCIPIYFISVFSGLTEIFFGFLLVLITWLYRKEKTALAFILLSLMPFVRSEGFLMFPAFVLMAFIDKRWKYLPLLASGSILYSVIAYFVYGNFNWLFGSNPYLVSGNVYDKGSLFHFLSSNEAIAGMPQVILILAGISWLCYSLLKNIKNKNYLWLFILVLGNFAAYFIAHSIFWYLGIFGSAGLPRVMAAIGPLMGIMSFFGFRFLFHLPLLQIKFKTAAWILFFLWVMGVTRKQYDYPRPLTEYEKLSSEACDWIKQNNISYSKIYFFDPFIIDKLGFDQFDTATADQITALRSVGFERNSLIYWDSYYCPNEAGIKKDTLDKMPLTLLKTFKDPTIITYKKDTFEIRIYKTN